MYHHARLPGRGAGFGARPGMVMCAGVCMCVWRRGAVGGEEGTRGGSPRATPSWLSGGSELQSFTECAGERFDRWQASPSVKD